MLFVFLVESGKMESFDMNLALENVSRLQDEIESRCKIERKKQVLLINGGETLNSNNRVCSYSAAGTDTNPIFLFNLDVIQKDMPPAPSLLTINKSGEKFNESDYETILNMLPSIHTLAIRTSKAEEFSDNAKQIAAACERIVHDQHLQQQGWAAVVANLDDITSAFKQKVDLIELNFSSFFENRSKHAQLLENFEKDVEMLKKIPVLKSLIFRIDDEENKEWESMSILEFIKSTENHRTLESALEICTRGLEQFDQKFHTTLMKEATMVLNHENNPTMKEIKGLEERLYGLDHLLCEAKRVVQDQASFSQLILQNQTRYENNRDVSIIPDLCASQVKPLSVMIANRNHLKDVYNRCFKAKKELSVNLHQRLKWVVYVEESIADVDDKLVVYHENLKRTKKQFEILEQIHLTPSIYFLSVAEITRRKLFSKEYSKWSREILEQGTVAFETEITARNEYINKVGTHFLQTIFPGLEIVPEEFSIQPLQGFDDTLPEISLADVQQLITLLPEATAYIDLNYLQKNVPFGLPNELPVAREVFVSAIEGVHSLSVHVQKAQDPRPIESPDDKDPESEPDTEEFEKVDQCSGVTEANLTNDDVKVELGEAIKIKEKMMQLQNAILSFQDRPKTLIDQLRLSLNDSKNYLKSCDEDLIDFRSALYSELNDKAKRIIESNQSELGELKQDISESFKQCKALETTFHSCCASINQLYNDKISNLEVKLGDVSGFINPLKKNLSDQSQKVRNLTLEHELELLNVKEGHRLDCAAFDKRINELIQELSEKATEMNTLKDRTEKEVEMKWLNEMQVFRNKLEAEFAEREEDILKIKMKEIEERYESNLKKTISENELMIEQTRNFMQNQFSSELMQLKNEMNQEKHLALEQMKESMTKVHLADIENFRAQTLTMDRSPSDGSLEKIEHPESSDPVFLEQQIFQLKAELQEKGAALEEIRLAYEQKLQDSQDRYDKAQDDSVLLMKASVTAEKQVSFNEAVSHITTEKDKIIQELQAQISQLKEELEYSDEKSKSISLSSPTNEYLSKSPSTTTIGPMGESCCVSSALDHSTLEEDQMSKSVPTQMEASTSTVPGSSLLEKVSFLTCAVGDLVFLTYDYKHENYMVFNKNPTLYFLNSDCWEELGLTKDPKVSGPTTKNWALGYITEKEYCQAKKEQNRFRVSLGTRFYRVRVREWTKAILSKRTSSMSASTRSLSLTKK